VFTAFSGTTMSSAKHTAMFAVIGKTCDACHDASTLKFYGVNNLTTRPSGHHTGQDCSGCHNTSGWGGGAQGKKKAATAPSTTPAKVGLVVRPGMSGRGSAAARLEQFGNVPGPLGAGTTSVAQNIRTPMPSHAGVVNNCVGCHNGVLAAGKGPAHVASNNTCENCHTTIAWIPARFDHRGVAAPCASCHNGAVASGKPTRHMQTNQDCGTCHGTIAWMPAVFNHVGVSTACQSCHNGITATGKQVQHLATTLDCSACHTTLGWTVAGTLTAPKTPLRPLITIPKPGPRGPNTGPQR
jgi:hypothetical protein